MDEFILEKGWIMKTHKLALLFTTLISLYSKAHALELMVVNNYGGAADSAIWENVKTDQLPQSLIFNEDIENPSASYNQIFPKTFLQEPLFAVCNKRCEQNDIFKIQNEKMIGKSSAKWDILEQSNVYFWLKNYFTFLNERFAFSPKSFLKVMTNREITDGTSDKKLKNNAFFNPLDTTLSFLPASKNLLFRLLAGKINRSGFDPSVIVHEASHYVFQHLFPNPINSEIGGLNEGFADYMANIYFKNPKIGLVMMQGKTIRDSSNEFDSNKKFKTYEPKMEVHELGERVTLALWKSRELCSDKEEMDRLVIDAVVDLNRNKYSTIHDFKMKMIERLRSVVDSINIKNMEQIWENIFPGKPTSIDNFNFLESKRTNHYHGYRTTQIIPEELAREYGTKSKETTNFTIIQTQEISENQIAILMSTEDEVQTRPYWIVIDKVRNNVIGIYTIDKMLVTDSKELKEIQFLVEKAKTAVKILQDFSEQINSFVELAEGKGVIRFIYKVVKKEVAPELLSLNGATIEGQKTKFYLKRRLLTGKLFGLTDIETIDLYSISNETIKDLPLLDGKTIIGYKIKLKNGTTIETFLEKLSN